MMGDGKWVYSMSSMFRVISIVSIVSMFSIISNCRIRILELSIWHLVLGIEYWVFSGEAAPDAKCPVLHAPVPPSCSSTDLPYLFVNPPSPNLVFAPFVSLLLNKWLVNR